MMYFGTTRVQGWDNPVYHNDPNIKIITNKFVGQDPKFEVDEMFVAFYNGEKWQHFKTKNKEKTCNECCERILEKYPDVCEILILNGDHPNSMGIHDKFDIQCIKENNAWSAYVCIRYLKGNREYPLEFKGIKNADSWTRIPIKMIPALPNESSENEKYEFPSYQSKETFEDLVNSCTAKRNPYDDGMQYIGTPSSLDILYDYISPVLGPKFLTEGHLRSFVRSRQDAFFKEKSHEDEKYRNGCFAKSLISISDVDPNSIQVELYVDQKEFLRVYDFRIFQNGELVIQSKKEHDGTFCMY